MKAFVTGGTGFVGGYVVKKLLERGYDVQALVRTPAKARELEAAGARLVEGDVTDKESMRAAMQGSEVVFHIAAWYVVGGRDVKRMCELVNVQGTRNVLGLAHELGIPKIVYTSTLGVNGDTKEQMVDETYRADGENLSTHYERTKWEAHYLVAEELVEQGAPIITVMPGVIFGPGDHSIIGEAFEMFLKGQLFFVPGYDTGVTYAHVDDIAEGHVVAAEKGVPGESYIITGPAMLVGELVGLWAEVLGRKAPALKIPSRILRPFIPLMSFLDIFLPLPQMFRGEAIRTLGVTYYGSADKAKRELGWEPRPVRERLEETVAAMKKP